MIFYHCNTAEGERVEGTQADAKAIDKRFTQIDIPTDKNRLKDFVNGLYARIAGGAAVEDDNEPLPAPIVVDANRQSKVPGGCPACDRTPRGAALILASRHATAIEDAIFTVEHDYLLKNIIEAAQSRLADLQRKAA